jgi:hypothetical protein
MTQAQTDRLALIAKRSKRTIEDVTELFEERAAIREYMGGAKRRDAETAALNDVADVVLR